MNQMFVYLAFFMMAALSVIILIRIIRGVSRFSRHLRYINSEINRTQGSEQKSWMRKKRRVIKKFYTYFLE